VPSRWPCPDAGRARPCPTVAVCRADWAGEAAGSDLVAEAFDAQADVGGSDFLRITANGGSVLLEPFQGLRLCLVAWHGARYSAGWAKSKANSTFGHSKTSALAVTYFGPTVIAVALPVTVRAKCCLFFAGTNRSPHCQQLRNSCPPQMYASSCSNNKSTSCAACDRCCHRVRQRFLFGSAEG